MRVLERTKEEVTVAVGAYSTSEYGMGDEPTVIRATFDLALVKELRDAATCPECGSEGCELVSWSANYIPDGIRATELKGLDGGRCIGAGVRRDLYEKMRAFAEERGLYYCDREKEVIEMSLGEGSGSIPELETLVAFAQENGSALRVSPDAA